MPEGVASLVVYAFTNRASGTAVSDWIQALPYQRYQADAWLRGQAGALVDGSALWVEFYNGAQFVGRERLWDNALLPLASAWQQAGDSFVLPHLRRPLPPGAGSDAADGLAGPGRRHPAGPHPAHPLAGQRRLGSGGRPAVTGFGHCRRR